MIRLRGKKKKSQVLYLTPTTLAIRMTHKHVQQVLAGTVEETQGLSQTCDLKGKCKEECRKQALMICDKAQIRIAKPKIPFTNC